jgi:hypothetical protein
MSDPASLRLLVQAGVQPVVLCGDPGRLHPAVRDLAPRSVLTTTPTTLGAWAFANLR